MEAYFGKLVSNISAECGKRFINAVPSVVDKIKRKRYCQFFFILRGSAGSLLIYYDYF